MKKILILSALCLLAFGCNEERTPGSPYGGDNYIYFLSDNSSANLSFDRYSPHIATISDRYSSYWEDTYDQDVTFDLMPLGRMSEQDRPASVAITNIEADNFPPAGAFEIVHRDKVLSIVDGEVQGLAVPANSAGTPFTVRLKYDKELFLANKGKKWQIVLECRENEYFKVWPETTNGESSTTGQNDGEPLARFTVNFGVSPNFN